MQQRKRSLVCGGDVEASAVSVFFGGLLTSCIYLRQMRAGFGKVSIRVCEAILWRKSNALQLALPFAGNSESTNWLMPD